MTSRLISRFEFGIYFCLWLLLGWLIFAVNEDSLPLTQLLDWQYWVPCLMYSTFVILFIMAVSKLVKLFIEKKIIVLSLSICLGTLLGLKSLYALTNWIFQ